MNAPSPPADPDVTRTQSGATIRKPIRADRVDDLKRLLATIGDDVEHCPDIPFTGLADAHFLSWFVIDAYAGTGPMLYLELNVDGPVGPFLHELVRLAGKGLDDIYAHCEGYPSAGSKSPAAVVAYLLEDDVGYDCYYIGWRGLTMQRIRRERGLRDRLEAALDRQDDAKLAAMTPSQVRALLQAEVDGDASLAWAKAFPPAPFLVRYRDQVVGALVVAAILLVLGLLWLAVTAWRFYGPARPSSASWGASRRLSRSSSPSSGGRRRPTPSRPTSRITTMSKTWRAWRIGSSRTTSPAAEPVKPGPFRLLVLKAVLKLIHVLAAVVLNQGNLSGINSIHFARWVVVDNGRRLLFLSNYDGSWENYLDDFIDRAHQGLTAIWSNTVGFPRSYLLVEGGATNELAFKTITRKSQVPSLVWYSAYSDLTVQNIQANRAIREGLFASMDAKAEQAWLALF